MKERKTLTLLELKELVDYHLKDDPESANKPVRLLVNEPSIGAHATVDVVDAGIGIDWDSNYFSITAKEPVCRKTEKEEMFEKMKAAIESYLYDHRELKTINRNTRQFLNCFKEVPSWFNKTKG
jgi:hypothetical protein